MADAELSDLSLANWYFAAIETDPGKEREETRDCVAEVRRRGLTVESLGKIVIKAAAGHAEEYRTLPLNVLGDLWTHAVDLEVRSEIVAVETELERRGATVDQAMDAVNAARDAG